MLVDGSYYTSPDTFSCRKAAEQDVAKIAFFGLSQKIKDEGCPLIREVCFVHDSRFQLSNVAFTTDLSYS